MKNFLKTDKFLYVVATLSLAIAGGHLLFSNTEFKRKNSSGEVLGSVRPMGPDVRLRGEVDPSWAPVRKNVGVYQDDRIFTGEKSSAFVQLKNNQKFVVEPNSLIKISDHSTNALIDIQGGSFFGELKKGAQFLVKSKSTSAEIKSNGGVIRFESNENKMKIVVLKGEATITADKESGKTQVVKANEEADIEYENIQVTPLRISLLKPVAGGVEWTDGSATEFQWATSENKLLRFEVSTDPSFKDILVSKNTDKNRMEVVLDPGQIYFWRVAEEGDKKDRSPVSSFSVNKLAPPVLNPMVAENKDHLEFNWTDPSLSESYELQASKDPLFEKVELSVQSFETQVSVPRVPTGLYYWRVISRHAGRLPMASKLSALDVAPTEAELAARKLAEAPPPLENPEFLKSEYNFELVEKLPSDVTPSSGFVLSVTPVFGLKKAKGAQVHEIEMSYYEDFKNTFSSDHVDQEEWAWKKPQVGQFFIRLKAVRDEEVTYSSISKVRVILSAPVFAKLSLNGKPNRAPTLYGKVHSHPLTSQTELQIATDESFSSGKTLKLEKNSFKILMSEPGVKYLRARSLNKDGWPISKYSDTKTVTVLALVPEEERPKPVVKSEPKPVLTKSEQPKEFYRKDPDFSIWGGLGMNYLSFSQKGGSDLDSGNFAKLSIGTLSVGGRAQIAGNKALEFRYNNWPGQLTGPNSASIDKTSYNLLSMAAEYQQRFVRKENYDASFLLGYQIGQSPFLAVDSSGLNKLLENETQAALLGAKINLFRKESIEYEFAARYHLLTNSKNLDSYSFQAKPGAIFDASFGLIKHYDNGMNFGLYWILDYQNLNYDFNINGTQSSGNQSFINSNIQFRIGYDFFGLTIIPVIPRRRRKKR